MHQILHGHLQKKISLLKLPQVQGSGKNSFPFEAKNIRHEENWPEQLFVDYFFLSQMLSTPACSLCKLNQNTFQDFSRCLLVQPHGLSVCITGSLAKYRENQECFSLILDFSPHQFYLGQINQTLDFFKRGTAGFYKQGNGTFRNHLQGGFWLFWYSLWNNHLYFSLILSITP